jgi:3-isopropylmalate/(R)-2-methylmalate dehydratase large subunit
MEERKIKEWKIFQADEDAVYDQIIDINLDELEPTVACPSSPENTKSIDEIKDIYIDQVVIGSCTNGRIEDMRAAGQILKNRKVDPGVRTIIIPATQEIYKQCIKEGLLEIFIDAGAVVSTPTCGPCLGGHMGILAAGEKAVTTTNRNFIGRMGHKESEVYLASPAVAAASAVTGKIENPNNLK